MKTSTDPTSARECTNPGPLASAILSAPLSESVSADFKKGTWTFKVPESQRVTSGAYRLLPEVVAQLALELHRIENDGVLMLTEPRHGKARFFCVAGNPALRITYECGAWMTLYRDISPPVDRTQDWHPAIWYGSEHRSDQNGRFWGGESHHYVQDDFGDLVQVPA